VVSHLLPHIFNRMLHSFKGAIVGTNQGAKNGRGDSRAKLRNSRTNAFMALLQQDTKKPAQGGLFGRKYNLSVVSQLHRRSGEVGCSRRLGMIKPKSGSVCSTITPG
jgi:hypothetical protein